MKLLKSTLYELYKLWSFKYLRVIFMLLLAVDLVAAWIFCYDYIKDEIENPKSYYTREDIRTINAKAEADPEWFESEYTRIMAEWDAWWEGPSPVNVHTNNDLLVFMNVHSNVHAHEEFTKKIESAIADAERILLFNSYYESDPETEAIKDYQRDIIERYTLLLQNVEPYESHTYGWAAYFDYSVAVLLLFIWATIIAVTAYHEHISSGFISISRICRRGRDKTAIAKFIAVAIVCVASVFVFLSAAMFIIEIRIGFTGGEASIQMLGDWYHPASDVYDYVPINVSIRGYALINAGIKCIVMIVLAAAVALVTSLSNNIFGYISGVAIVVSQLMISRAEIITTSQWRYMNLVDLCTDNVFLIKLREVTLFGKAWDLFAVAVLSLLAVTLICVPLVVYCYSYRRAAVKSASVIIKKFSVISEMLKSKLRARRYYRYSMSIWRYEISKNRVYLLILFVFLIMMFVSSAQYYATPATAYDRMYGEIMQTLEGEYTEEKARYIQEKYNEYNAVAGLYEKYNNDYMMGNISAEEFSAYYKQYQVASGQLPVWRDLLIKTEYLAEVPGGWYMYDTGIIKYINQDNDWFLLVFILLLGGGMYLPEYGKTSSRSTVISVIRTTKHGRRNFTNMKYAFVFVSAFVTSIASNSAEIYCYLQNYDISAISAPMRSLEEYENMPSWMTVGGYFVTVFILSLVGAVMLMLFAASVSALGERAVTVYPVLTLSLLMPYVASELGMSFMSYIDLTRLSDTSRLISLTIDNGLYLTAVYYIAAAIGIFAIIRTVYVKTERRA